MLTTIDLVDVNIGEKYYFNKTDYEAGDYRIKAFYSQALPGEIYSIDKKHRIFKVLSNSKVCVCRIDLSNEFRHLFYAESVTVDYTEKATVKKLEFSGYVVQIGPYRSIPLLNQIDAQKVAQAINDKIYQKIIPF